MPSPRPKPTALKLAQGNPGKRPLNKQEPQAKGVPKPPEHLPDLVRQAWFVVVPMLMSMGTVGEADAFAIELLCESYVRWQRLLKVIDAEGEYYECPTENGGVRKYKHPLLDERNVAFSQYKGMLIEYGLTAAARTKVKSSEPAAADPADQFFAAG